MGEKLQPFMDFALDADDNVTDRFRFQDTDSQVAGSQRDISPTNCCVAVYQKMTRLALLANLKSLRLLENEWVILPCMPAAGDRASPTSLSVAPKPVAPPAEGGGRSSGKFGKQLNGTGTHLSGRLSGRRDNTHKGPRDVAIEPLDVNNINADHTPLPRKVSQRMCLCGDY